MRAVSPLDAKLLRDLWRIKGQALAIALVMAAGIMSLVQMSGLVLTLDGTRLAYYERYRLAEVYAPATRAPEAVAMRLAEVEGARRVVTRINGAGQLDLDGQALPIPAQALSLPPSGVPALNALALTDGRFPNPQRGEEVILLDSFATARDLGPGDTLEVTLNGTKRSLRVVGLGQAPEFVYITAPGEMVPDDARFAVLWMGRDALAAAMDMSGAFNEALLTLERGADLRDVLAQVDAVLAPYGGRGAYGVEDLGSNRFLTEEISGLRASGAMVPPIFLAVAAFLLNVVVARLVQAEREQIGLLKAFGYTGAEIGLHYTKLVAVIAVLGAVLGILMGIAAGRSMAVLYQQYFKFPFLVFEVAPSTFATGFLLALGAAIAAAAFVLRGVFALTPAVAMRPPAPADYSRAGRSAKALLNWLDQPLRMVFRRVFRQPGRFLGSVAGISAGMALAGGMMTVMNGFNDAVNVNFSVIDRSDITVTYTHAVSDRTALELGRVPGVEHVEPVRYAPVQFVAGRNSYRGAITGLSPEARLNRAIDAEREPLSPPEGGILLSRTLAGILEVGPGDPVTLRLLDGDRRSVRLPVAGVADTLIGAPAFMELSALNRALGTPDRITGAFLTIDAAQADAIYAALKARPGVAGVSVKEEARAAFQHMIDQGMGSMRYVLTFIAGVIAFGIVYNTARIAFAERARDLASLRVLGFTKSETAFVLLGELALTVAVALPAGALAGWGFSFLIAQGFSTDLYQIPAEFSPTATGAAMLAVVVPAILSGILVRRDMSRLDLVSALKTRE